MYVLDGAVQTDSEMHCAEESGFYHRTDSGTAEPNRASLLTPPSTQTREQYRPNRVQIALVILSSAIACWSRRKAGEIWNRNLPALPAYNTRQSRAT